MLDIVTAPHFSSSESQLAEHISPSGSFKCILLGLTFAYSYNKSTMHATKRNERDNSAAIFFAAHNHPTYSEQGFQETAHTCHVTFQCPLKSENEHVINNCST